jgi:hypothetical protein
MKLLCAFKLAINTIILMHAVGGFSSASHTLANLHLATDSCPVLIFDERVSPKSLKPAILSSYFSHVDISCSFVYSLKCCLLKLHLM